MTSIDAPRLRLTPADSPHDLPHTADVTRQLRVILEMPYDLVSALGLAMLPRARAVTQMARDETRQVDAADFPSMARFTGYLDWNAGLIRLSNVVDERCLAGVRSETGEQPSGEFAAACGDLTGRQQQVTRLLAEGYSNVEIARALGISEHTARRHTEAVLRKLGVRSRAAVGAALRRNGPSGRS